ncbi:hypothetical protein KIPB_010907, partial [Kipferlia bialata]
VVSTIDTNRGMWEAVRPDDPDIVACLGLEAQ